MGANQNMARSKPSSDHHYLLVMVLASVVVNAFRRLDQKPDQIQHNCADKVKNDLINDVAGKNAGIVKYHITNGVLHTYNKWQNGVLDRSKKTHNRYSTFRREKYKCLSESFFITKPAILQILGMNYASVNTLKGVC